MFRATLLSSVAILMMATSSIASNLVWYTEPGSNVPAFSTGEKVKGVNLGNWFILVRHRDGDFRIWAGGILIIALRPQENWMEPSLFGVAGLPGRDNDTQVMDEWTFCSILGKTRCAEVSPLALRDTVSYRTLTSLSQVLEEHWDTWITEDDFKRMADYGLNTVRIPIPYWVYNVTEDEPYITQKQIPYIQKALNWSSLYGLDVMMDLHAVPGKTLTTQLRACPNIPLSRLAIDQPSPHRTLHARVFPYRSRQYRPCAGCFGQIC